MRPIPRNRLLWVVLVLIPVALLVTQNVRADDEEVDHGRIYAIQPRAFRLNQEFTLSMSFLPLDAFYKMFAVGGHYIVHLDDLWAWEAIHLTFSKYMSLDTGLKGELLDQWKASPTDPEENRVDMGLDTNLIYKPLYAKSVLFDQVVVISETYFIAGLGAQKFETTWAPAVNLGVGFRIFLAKTISLRLEVREYIYYNDLSVDGLLSFGLGLSYNAFAEDRRPISSAEVDE
jgi:outer membrane beta-barrel protein